MIKNVTKSVEILCSNKVRYNYAKRVKSFSQLKITFPRIIKKVYYRDFVCICFLCTLTN